MKRKGKMMTEEQPTFTEEIPTRPDIPSVLPPPEPAPVRNVLDVEPYRLAASMLLTYAVDAGPGGHGERSTSDPVYKSIVEGRGGPKYSSCGDLAHWLLYRLGVRAPFVNRQEFTGWRVGLNLNLLCPYPVGTCPVAVHPVRLTEMPDVQPGDLLQVSNVYGGHQVCVSGREDTDGVVTLTTAEYGQPGGARKVHTLKLIGGSLWLGNEHGANQVVSWIPLPAALGLLPLAPPDVRALTDAELVTLGKGLPGFTPVPFVPASQDT